MYQLIAFSYITIHYIYTCDASFWKTYHLHTSEIIRILNLTQTHCRSQLKVFLQLLILVIQCIVNRYIKLFHQSLISSIVKYLQLFCLSLVCRWQVFQNLVTYVSSYFMQLHAWLWLHGVCMEERCMHGYRLRVRKL